MNLARSPPLPVELVSMTLNMLDIESLVHTSHVSSTWRILARSQPRFWCFVRLAALSHSAIAFFQDRLSCKASNTRSINITLELDHTEDPGYLRAIVLPLLTRNLFRLEILCIIVSPSSASALADSLRHAAPRLKEFLLYYRHINEGPLAPPLPVDLFAGPSPQLKRVGLRDVQLPQTAIAAFRHAIDPTFISHVPQPISAHFLDHFPRAQYLAVAASSCGGSMPEETPYRPFPTPALDTIFLRLQLFAFEPFLAAIPNIAVVRQIECRQGCPRLVKMLMDHMPDGTPLRLDVSINNLETSLIGISYFIGTYVRNFKELPTVVSWPRSALFSPHFIVRVTTLSIQLGVVSLAPVLPTLPNCTQLAIRWESGSIDVDVPQNAIAPRTGPFLPKLTTVFVRGGPTETKIDAGSLAGLLPAFLNPTQVGLNMRIGREVTITGDIWQLDSRFRIEYM